MRKTLIILFFFGGSVLAQAPDSGEYQFTLQQAISHALEHNYSILNATRDVQAAEKTRWETAAIGLPQINAGIDYTNNIEIPLSVIPAQFFDTDAPPGTFTPVAFSPKQSATARATLSQLIFDGSYIVALQASKVYLDFYKNYKQKANNEIRTEVVTAYGNALLADESIRILEQNKTSLEKTLHETSEIFENGLIEEENVEQLQITLTSINSSLKNVLRLRDISYNFLKLSLGIDLSNTLKLTDKLENLTTENLKWSLTESEFDVSQNIDFKISQNFSEQRRLELAREKSRALPSLFANLTYGANTFNNDFEFLKSTNPWFDFAVLGVSLQVPVFSSLARTARTQKAKIALEQAKTQLTETEQRLKLAYQNARSNYEFSVEEYATSKSNLQLAERIQNKQQIKFSEGLSSSFDFSDAQRQLYAAQQAFLQSMVNVIRNKAQLESIINSN